ncbi:MAG: VWA domain-containing protein [Myxococcales bacterium]|nr:VWA domain-containing protein [Myxococcales bacterium]
MHRSRSSVLQRSSSGKRRALAHLLLCAALLPACGKRQRTEASAQHYAQEGADSTAMARPVPMAPDSPAPAAEPAQLATPPLLDPTASAETYKDHGRNPWIEAARDRLSTFAADVDTASYSIMRRKLTEGTLPPPASVRVEEYVNYFRYSFPSPTDGVFSVVAEAAPSPFTEGRHLVRIGVATKAKSVTERKPMNLVFLVDTSGSMASADKLGLAKRALHILVDNLKDGDTVALTSYAGSSEVLLSATGVAQREKILSAIDSLGAGGSTAMGSGIELAYREASKHARPEALSRVIVLSDGDANVGPTSHQQILSLIAQHAHEGISLSTIGFGMGNYKDETMEQLANKGDGNNFYIDTIEQARRVFQEQLGSTLEVVAKDAKLQVEFDPLLVARYRLLGYENRDVADRDFRNDQVDAGEIGAGHQVTAMYEVELTQTGLAAPASLLTVRTRYRSPLPQEASEPAREAAFPMPAVAVATSFEAASVDFRFAFAVSAFADILRKSADSEHWSLAKVRGLAKAAAGTAEDRQEFLRLIDRALLLAPGNHPATAKLAR